MHIAPHVRCEAGSGFPRKGGWRKTLFREGDVAGDFVRPELQPGQFLALINLEAGGRQIEFPGR